MKARYCPCLGVKLGTMGGGDIGSGRHGGYAAKRLVVPAWERKALAALVKRGRVRLRG
jgi:hypothetical protein